MAPNDTVMSITRRDVWRLYTRPGLLRSRPGRVSLEFTYHGRLMDPQMLGGGAWSSRINRFGALAGPRGRRPAVYRCNNGLIHYHPLARTVAPVMAPAPAGRDTRL